MSRTTAVFLSLLLAGTLLHVPALAGGFVWDDDQMIVTNPELRDLSTIPDVFGHNYFGDRGDAELYRPLVNVSLAIDWHLWGHDERGDATPFGYHLTNLLLHLGATVLLFTLLRRLTTRPLLPEAAALIFLVHPAAAEPVGWIVSRADLMGLAGILGVIHLHLSGRKRPWLHAVALLVYLAAMFSKLVAGPAPLFVFLVEWILLGLSFRALARPRNLWRYGSYLVPIAIYALVRVNAMGSFFPRAHGVTWQGADAVAALFVGGALVFRGGFLLLLPTNLCADYQADPAFRESAPADLAGHGGVALLAGLAVLLIGVAILARRRRPWFALAVLWAAAGFLPVAQVARIGAVMADRYLYVPAAGAAIGLAAALLVLPRWRVPFFVALVVSFGAVTVSREAVWRSDLAMNGDVLRSYPDNGHAFDRIGLHWSRKGDREREERAYREGLARDPGNRYLASHLGALLYQEGRLAEARAVLEPVLLRDRHRDLVTAKLAYHLALVLRDLGEVDRAREIAAAAVRQCPPLGVLSDLSTRLGSENPR